MKKGVLLGSIVLMTCALSGAALAQQDAKDAAEQGKGAVHVGFDQLDKNRDGKMTWEEFQAAYPKASKDEFNKIDNDKSGAIERNEWDLHKERFHDTAKKLNKEHGVQSSGDEK